MDKRSDMSRDEFRTFFQELVDIGQDQKLHEFLVEGEKAATTASSHDPVLGQKMAALIRSARDLFSYAAERSEDAGRPRDGG